MSLECGECERDLRGGHGPDCSRNPNNKKEECKGCIGSSDQHTCEGWEDFQKLKAQKSSPSFTANETMRLANDVGRWADSIMPHRTPADAIKKLSMEEVPELWRSLKEDGQVDEGEIADVLILALDVCYMSGINPHTAIKKKMEINRQRSWKFEYGVLQHED